MSANEGQIGGVHYKNKAIQPWDYVVANGLGYFEGNVLKYITRFREKNELLDLFKAQHYLEKLIELEVGRFPIQATEETETPAKKRRGRPPKAPYGLKADGTPYKRRPNQPKETKEQE